MLNARGIAVARRPAELRDLLGRLSSDATMAAALACTDAAGFRRRVREQDAAHRPPGPDR